MKLDITKLQRVSKAVAGAVVAGSAGGIISPMVIIPPDVSAPWWAYLIAAAMSAAIGFAGVYVSPRNDKPAASKPAAS